MSSTRRVTRLPSAALAVVALATGLGTYGVRVWWHREAPDLLRPSAGAAPAAGLPRPESLSAEDLTRRQLPAEINGYRLVSVIPEVKDHDLHALYEADDDHHASLFVQPIPAHPGPITSDDVGPYWGPSAAVAGHPAFERTDIHHRSALAWVARGKRHIVTGDIPLAQLRTFAEAYEAALSQE